MRLHLLLTLLVVDVSSVSTYPLYKQCDPRWGHDMMGINGTGHRASICAEGCAMSCVAMVLEAAGYTLPGAATAVITPGSLNSYLISHHGYHCEKSDCDNLVLTAPDRLTGKYFHLYPSGPFI
jgi:hypothetical protein